MQGSGKGTQGKILAERYGLKIFDMGRVLREQIASGSELGNRIKDIVHGGDLVDDDTIMEVVQDFMNKIPKEQNILFDGVPRTKNQTDKLLALLESYGRDAFALDIKISEREAVERLTKRRICVDCREIYPAFFKGDQCSECGGKLITRRDDSNRESIDHRLRHFTEETEPVIGDFYKRDRLIEVDGEQDIPDVTEEMIDKAGYLFS